MLKFTTVLWDADNTLLDFDYSQRYALKKCFRSIGREATEEQIARYDRINDDYWKRLERGEVTKRQLLSGRFVTLFQEIGITDVDVEAFRQEYQTALGSVFSFLDDSLTICRTLQGKVKQYVITNGVAATQRNKLKLSGLLQVMDGVFISEEIGSPKPSPVFFDFCLEHLSEKDKSKILIVGDSLTSDIKGGVQAGIPTCWYHAAGKGGNCVTAGSGEDMVRESSFGTGNFGSKVKVTDAECKPDYVISDLHMVYDILGV